MDKLQIDVHVVIKYKQAELHFGIKDGGHFCLDFFFSECDQFEAAVHNNSCTTSAYEETIDPCVSSENGTSNANLTDLDPFTNYNCSGLIKEINSNRKKEIPPFPFRVNCGMLLK